MRTRLASALALAFAALPLLSPTAMAIEPDSVSDYGAPAAEATATLRVQGATDPEFFAGLFTRFTVG